MHTYNLHIHVHVHVHVITYTCIVLEMDIRFEAWAKLAQQWLVSAPLILSQLTKRELCSAI